MVDRIAEGTALSDEELMAGLDGFFRQKSAAEGCIIAYLGEIERRQAFREEGATSTEEWAVERFGISTSTARALTHVGERARDIPHFVAALCAGDLSFDKVRVVADVINPEPDKRLQDEAAHYSVRQLADMALASAPPRPPLARSEFDRRSVRFNDTFRTVTVQLPPEYFAETRACLEARAGIDGDTPWDQRLCDAFLEIVRLGWPS
jgi:hypothetical protein